MHVSSHACTHARIPLCPRDSFIPLSNTPGRMDQQLLVYLPRDTGSLGWTKLLKLPPGLECSGLTAEPLRHPLRSRTCIGPAYSLVAAIKRHAIHPSHSYRCDHHMLATVNVSFVQGTGRREEHQTVEIIYMFIYIIYLERVNNRVCK